MLRRFRWGLTLEGEGWPMRAGAQRAVRGPLSRPSTRCPWP